MRLFNLAIIIIILIIPSVHAWSWDSYEGKTTWDVKVTVDEAGCGGNAHSYNTPLTITHKKSVADLTDLGHGPVSGTFFSNILTVPGRTIPDGSGSSALGSASVAFTPDCLSFYTKYPWHYKDQYQDCSGTTAWKGKRTDAKECPDAFVVTENTRQGEQQTTTPPATSENTQTTTTNPTQDQGQAQEQETPAEQKTKQYQPPTLPSPPTKPKPQPTEELGSSNEEKTLPIGVINGLPISERKAEYEKILKKNPDDFVANYEIAELNKDEKDYADFIKHIDKALENTDEAEKLKQEREKEVTQRLELTIRPNGITVPLLRSAKDQLDNVPQPMIYDFNVLKTPDTRTWYQKWTEYLSKKLATEPATN